MSIEVIPQTLIAGADDPAYEVSKNVWNAGGLVSGSGGAEGDVAIIDGAGDAVWGAQPACQVTRAATQAIANATNTAVSWDAETFDPEAMHDPSTNPTRITIPSTGLWLVTASVKMSAHATGIRKAYLATDGTLSDYVTAGGLATASDLARMHIAAILYAATTHYYELVVYQSSGGGLNVEKAVMTMMKLGSV